MVDGKRVVSGMRATGPLHLGHYHGVLKNWMKLQNEHDCLFFVADWHALTTHYENVSEITNNVWHVVIDWLAAGLNPNACKLFIQSHVPDHAQLHLLLSMMTPLSWLERVPTYKDQQDKIKDKDLSTYGFLGYPVLQAADVLLYKAHYIPVGEDQQPHVEMARDIAKRFNHLYGREPDFEEKSESAIAKMGKKNAKQFKNHLKTYQEAGDTEALSTGQAMIAAAPNLSVADRERLYGYLEGGGKVILPEPQVLLDTHAKMPGLDGQKMSKSYNNVIGLRESAESTTQKIKTMPTDPARVRRTDPGDPAKCPVFGFHQIYSDDETKTWVQKECRSAGIGCLDCKQKVIEKVVAEQAPMIERGQEYENNPGLVREIVREGAEAARDIAKETMDEVSQALNLPR